MFRPTPALMLLLLLGTAAEGRDLGRQDPDMIAPQAPVDGTLVDLGTLDARLTVPVALGASGPYNFIIDTGAERTVVSRELAGSLRLVPSQPVMLTSMTGSRRVDTVLVPQLMIPSVGEHHSIVAPALAGRNLGAAGLLGIDTLQNHQVTIDFDSGTMSVRPSAKRKRKTSYIRGEIVVTAKSLFGQLIVTDAYFGNTRVQVVLDTGAQVTMGNSALRRRIGGRLKTQPIEFTSVLGDTARAEYSNVEGIKIGDVLFGSMPVAFADVAPFERFGLTERPALLLGMDALRSFRRVEIDFPNRQVRFQMPKSALRDLNRTGSLIPGGTGTQGVRSY
ncbi:MAG: aspartyl protease family protein [Sphingomonas sp.]|uniref:aspartyl protease family protein n=1 Tax=Sphingomonas sp. TaxID=28214 RepID=UPI001B0690D5|nr:aspartyl protease family protein [Sphingomonas sp.]MBO9622199.1 aspartyl protease family protein [Sphingomonas sp.]